MPLDLTKWLSQESGSDAYFSANFWLIWSDLDDQSFESQGGFSQPSARVGPFDKGARVSVKKRTSKETACWFWLLPFSEGNLKLVLSTGKPAETTRHAYRLLARFRGKAQFYPIGNHLIRALVRVSDEFRFEDSEILRSVSYPSPPSEGGADINLLPDNVVEFFERVEQSHRVLKLVRVRAPSGSESFCEYTLSRVGYVSYHNGDPSAFLLMLTRRLAPRVIEAVKPYRKAKGNFVTFRFTVPVFASKDSYGPVVEALKRLPHSTVAVLHANPYFHATLTNYEDGGQFDIFITDPSTISVEGHGDISPASFIRLQNCIGLLFQDASIGIQKPSGISLKDLIGERP